MLAVLLICSTRRTEVEGLKGMFTFLASVKYWDSVHYFIALLQLAAKKSNPGCFCSPRKFNYTRSSALHCSEELLACTICFIRNLHRTLPLHWRRLHLSDLGQHQMASAHSGASLEPIGKHCHYCKGLFCSICLPGPLAYTHSVFDRPRFPPCPMSVLQTVSLQASRSAFRSCVP